MLVYYFFYQEFVKRGRFNPHGNKNIMGCFSSKKERPSAHFKKISDRFETVEQVQQGLREVGLESSNLIIGIDYTKSNLWNGKVSFGGKSLHHIGTYPNPCAYQNSASYSSSYQQVIEILGETLSAFDDDNLIPVFGYKIVILCLILASETFLQPIKQYFLSTLTIVHAMASRMS